MTSVWIVKGVCCRPSWALLDSNDCYQSDVLYGAFSTFQKAMEHARTHSNDPELCQHTGDSALSIVQMSVDTAAQPVQMRILSFPDDISDTDSWEHCESNTVSGFM